MENYVFYMDKNQNSKFYMDEKYIYPYLKCHPFVSKSIIVIC
jgi:hypothetical protein